MIICSGYHGRDPVVRGFFFGAAGYRDTMRHSDEAVLAVEGSSIVGGALLRGQEVICVHADSDSIREMLSREVQKRG